MSSQPTSSRDGWKSRIVEYGEEAPDQLLANPRNWRIHPKYQQDAISEALGKIGWIQNIIVNRTTGHVIDGHLRVAVSLSRGEETVPVMYVELSEEEERLALATIDPIGALAVTDDGALKGLLGDLEGEIEGQLAQMLAGVTRNTGSVAPMFPTQEQIDAQTEKSESRFDGAGAGRMREVTCPTCGGSFGINLDELGEK